MTTPTSPRLERAQRLVRMAETAARSAFGRTDKAERLLKAAQTDEQTAVAYEALAEGLAGLTGVSLDRRRAEVYRQMAAVKADEAADVLEEVLAAAAEVARYWLALRLAYTGDHGLDLALVELRQMAEATRADIPDLEAS